MNVFAFTGSGASVSGLGPLTVQLYLGQPVLLASVLGLSQAEVLPALLLSLLLLVTSLGFRVLSPVTLSLSPAVALASDPAARWPLDQPPRGPHRPPPRPPSAPLSALAFPQCLAAGGTQALSHLPVFAWALPSPQQGSSTELVLPGCPSGPAPSCSSGILAQPQAASGPLCPRYPCLSCSRGPSLLGLGQRSWTPSSCWTELVAPGPGSSSLPCAAPGPWMVPGRRSVALTRSSLACSAERPRWRGGQPKQFHFKSSPTTWPRGGWDSGQG